VAEWLTIFSDGSGGYGDYRIEAAPSQARAYTLATNRYHFSGGIDARTPGQLSLSPTSTRVATQTTSKDTAVGAVVWTDALGPAFFAPVGIYCIRLGHTNTSEDTLGTVAATGVCLHTDNASVQYLYASFGASDYISRRVVAGTWSQDADVTALQMDSLDDGRMAKVNTNGYQISICPAGADPFTIANWGAGISVGKPQNLITALTHIGDILIVCKTDGAYAYNPVNATFVNLTPSIAVHDDNGKRAIAVGGLGVLMPLANGDMVQIDTGLQARSVGPGINAQPGRDTPLGRITAICYTGEWGYAYTEPFTGKTPGAGRTTYGLGTAVVLEYPPGTFTDYSAVACDNNANTCIELTGAISNGGDAYLYVGANVPFEGAYLTMRTVNTESASLFTNVYYSSPGWAAVSGGLIDLTWRTIPNCGFARSGYIGWPTKNIPNLMAKATVNGKERYWVKFKFGSIAAVK
jgi:hypothetical protein